jgi:hypothetical protein
VPQGAGLRGRDAKPAPFARCANPPLSGTILGMTDSSTITLRAAGEAEDAVLRELAALDSARPLRRPALLAVVDGRPVAARSLRDDRVVADPFVPTGDVVALLRAARPRAA